MYVYSKLFMLVRVVILSALIVHAHHLLIRMATLTAAAVVDNVDGSTSNS
jgi:ADP-ribosylglycohydrolase